jgi:hypothetical protein
MMFDRNSRYSAQPAYLTRTSDGRTVVAVTIPLPRTERSAGEHRRREGDRLDLLAARYLNEPTTFWRLCDLNGASVPAALEARPLIAIPRGGRR